MSVLKQFDLFPAPGDAGHPYYVVLQSDLLQGLTTRVVAPLVDAGKLDPLDTLWPRVAVGSNSYVVLVPLLQSRKNDQIPAAIGSLAAHGDAIVSAMTLLHTPPE